MLYELKEVSRPGRRRLRTMAGPVATGAVGVLAYYNPTIDRTLAVMWSVAFDCNWYKNGCNVYQCDGNTKADYDMYNDLYYYYYPFKANGWHERDLGSALKCRGSISSKRYGKWRFHCIGLIKNCLAVSFVLSGTNSFVI